MAAQEAQLVDPITLPAVSEYQFSGDKVTQAKKHAFIDALRSKSTVYHAAQAARISRKTAYQWYDRDSQFAEAWEDSLQDAADAMETSTYEEALGSPEKPGNPLLKMFWLKAHRPKYRDRVSVDVEVVRNEIEERMNQLSLKQLPVLTAEFLDGETSIFQAQQPDSLPPEQIQKEQSEE